MLKEHTLESLSEIACGDVINLDELETFNLNGLVELFSLGTAGSAEDTFISYGIAEYDEKYEPSDAVTCFQEVIGDLTSDEAGDTSNLDRTM